MPLLRPRARRLIQPAVYGAVISGGGAEIFDEQFTTGTYSPRAIASELVDTRSTTKNVIDASGNFASIAIDTLPISNAGMLVEPAATNYFLQSGSPLNAAWTVKDLDTGTGDTGPSGAASTKLIPNTTSSDHYHQQGPLTVSSGDTVTHWRVVKADGFGWVGLSVYDTAHHVAWFNITTGAIGTVQSGVTAHTPRALSNSYWLVGITYTITGTTAYATMFPVSADGQAFTPWSGNGISGLMLDVSQFEVGTSPSSYIATTSAPVARSADSIAVQRTGLDHAVFTFDDASQQTISGISTGSKYTIPTNLNRRLITRMKGYASTSPPANGFSQPKALASAPWNSGSYLSTETRVDNAAVAPDGSTTATSMADTAASGIITAVKQNPSSGATINIAIKPGSQAWAFIQINGGSPPTANVIYFDLSGAGAVGTVMDLLGGSIHMSGGSITALANGYYRISVVTDAGSLSDVYFGSTTQDNDRFSNGTGAVTCYLWDAEAN